MKRGKNGFYYRYIKRLLDIVISFTALVVLSPLMLIICLLIWMKLGTPVLFTQRRIGKDEKTFVMMKFRSMSDARDESGQLLPDVQRIGKFGAFLRSSSIDELPGLINVLNGSMSLIGPRPLPVIYLPYFNEQERKRHSICGGLSGLAQVNGRNILSWEEKFAYDLEYVDNVSFILDAKIVFLTIVKVLKHSDIGLRGVSGPEDFDAYRAREMGVK